MPIENEDQEKKNEQVVTREQFDKLLAVVEQLKDENKVLKAHADETIQEKRAAKAKYEQEKAELNQQLEEKVNRTKDENEQLIKQYKEQNAELAKNIEEFKQKEYRNKLDSKALELAQKLAAKHPERAALLAKEFKERIKLDDDGSVKVLDEKGNITISPVDQLVNEYSTKYAFLCDGIDSTGGGSHSSADINSTQTKRFRDMNEHEKIALLHEDPTKYNSAKLADRDQD